MIPGEILVPEGDIELNAGRRSVTLTVANTGDRPIQVGSHYHFFETNTALDFDRNVARGHRLDIPAGTAVRFEPGQTREVGLVEYAGARRVYGFRGQIMGPREVTKGSASAGARTPRCTVRPWETGFAWATRSSSFRSSRIGRFTAKK